MTIYYDIGCESQHYTEDFREISTPKAGDESGTFAKTNTPSNAAQAGGNLAAGAVAHSTPFSNATIIANAANTYQRKRKPKPITKLDDDRDLTSTQLLRFTPRRTWKHLTHHERMTLIAKAVYLSEAVAFSLNLSRKLERDLKAAGNEARKTFSDRLRRQLKRCFSVIPEVSFLFEFDDDERLHVHGIAVLPDHRRETLAAFKLALRHAGGIDQGAASRYQADVKPLRSNGWQFYITKDTDRTAELLRSDRIAYFSNSMTALAKAEHARTLARSKPKADRSTKTAVVTHTAPTDTTPAPDSPKPAHDSQRPAMAVSRLVRDRFTIDEADIPTAPGVPAGIMREIDALLDGW
jgi:hypothetical protein